MKTIRLFYLLLLLFTITDSFGQSGVEYSISGRVTDGREPLPGANVTLTVAGDSTARVSAICNEEGLFRLSISPNMYVLTVSYVGFRSYSAQVVGLSDIKMPDIQLSTDTHSIGGVTVTGKRMTYDSKGYTFNLQNEPLFRHDRLAETLSQLPGLTYSDGMLQAYQQQILSVFVNDKKLRLPMPDIMRMLSTYKSKNIVSVAVLNSTADPEEATRMGYVLKITTREAANGGEADLDLSSAMGTRKPFMLAPSLTLSHRQGKWSFYMAPEYTPRNNLILKRETTTRYATLQQLRQEQSETHANVKNHLEGTANIAYDFTGKTSLMASISYLSFKGENLTATTNKTSNPEGHASTAQGNTHNGQDYHSANATLDFQTKLKNVTLKAYAIHAFNNQDRTSFVSQQTLTDKPGSIAEQQQDIRYRSELVGASGSWKPHPAHSISVSMRYAYWNNRIDAHEKGNNSQGAAAEETTAFKLKERSCHATATYGYAKGRVDLNVGVGMNHSRQVTDMAQPHGEAGRTETVRTLLEPSATLSLLTDKSRNQYLTVRYQHSSLWPSFGSYNPVRSYDSDYSYSQGSPSQEVGSSNDFRIQTTLGQWAVYGIAFWTSSSTRIYQVDDQGRIMSTLGNGNHSTTLSAGFSSPVIRPGKRWMLTFTGNCQWNRDSFQQTVAHGLRAGINVTSTASLPWGMVMRINGQLNTRQTSVFAKTDDPLRLSVNLKKTWLNDALTTSLGAHLWSKHKVTMETQQFWQQSQDRTVPASISLYVSYNLGWGNRYADVKKKLDSNVELQRMND